MRFPACLIIVAVAGCATPVNYVCSTRCGIHLRLDVPDDVRDGWSCVALQSFEDNLVHAVSVSVDRTMVRGRFRFAPNATEAQICEAIGGARGVVLYIQATPDFYYSGMQVGGITQCDFHSILVGKGPTPGETSLAHEMLHWLQGCHWDVEAHAAAVNNLPEALLACLLADVDSGADGQRCFNNLSYLQARTRQSGFHGYWDEIGITAAISLTNELSKKEAIK